MEKNALLSEIHKELKPLGFRRKGPNWNRGEVDKIDVINIQSSQWSRSVTINLYVVDVDIEHLIWGKTASGLVRGPAGVVQLRIGSLLDDRKDKWWDLDDINICREIILCIKKFALPFLDRMSSLEARFEWLTAPVKPKYHFPTGTLYYAAVLWKLGNVRAACDHLHKLKDQYPGFVDRVNIILDRMACEDRTGGGRDVGASG